jgi:DNA-binding PadR family transcriptional regulator
MQPRCGTRRSKAIYSITGKGTRALEETLFMHDEIRKSIPAFAEET